MKCPVDSIDLVMSDRQGIEIDYCPKCRGVWLDRGELDKIIDRSSGEPRGDHPAKDTRYRDEPRYRDEGQHHGRPYKKRKSLLGEIFDF